MLEYPEELVGSYGLKSIEVLECNEVIQSIEVCESLREHKSTEALRFWRS